MEHLVVSSTKLKQLNFNVIEHLESLVQTDPNIDNKDMRDDDEGETMFVTTVMLDTASLLSD